MWNEAILGGILGRCGMIGDGSGCGRSGILIRLVVRCGGSDGAAWLFLSEKKGSDAVVVDGMMCRFLNKGVMSGDLFLAIFLVRDLVVNGKNRIEKGNCAIADVA